MSFKETIEIYYILNIYEEERERQRQREKYKVMS